MDERLERFRASVAQLGARGRGKRYPLELVAEAKRYLAERSAAGATRAGVAEELGLSERTLAEWAKKASGDLASRGFRQVAVAPEHQSATLSLVGPGGLRIEGLTVELAAALMRSLS